MNKVKTIPTMSDEQLISAYKELKLEKLPQGNQSHIRNLQTVLSREEGKVIPLTRVMYEVTMEMIDRFCEIE